MGASKWEKFKALGEALWEFGKFITGDPSDPNQKQDAYQHQEEKKQEEGKGTPDKDKDKGGASPGPKKRK